MNELVPLALIRGATVVAGIVFLLYAAQAYRTYRSKGLAILAIAIALMITGVLVEGIAFFAFGASLGTAETIEAAMMLLAFLLLLWSVARRPSE